MTKQIDAYWSFRSPYCYLVCEDLLQLERDYDVDVELRVVLPIAVRDKGLIFNPENKKPSSYIVMDACRRGEFLGREISYPPVPDPVVQNMDTYKVAEEQPYIFKLCKLGVEANRLGKGPEFVTKVSKLIFGGTKNWDEGEHLQNAVESIGLNYQEMLNAIEGGDHLEEIETNQNSLSDAGHWGVPTMVLDGEPFFGQDRIELLRWRLDQLGLKRS